MRLAPDRSDAARYRSNLQGEVDGASLYRALAQAEADPHVAEVYRRLAAIDGDGRVALGHKLARALQVSFGLFALGALFPVVPLVFFDGRAALVAALVSSTLALFAIGASTSLFTGRHLLFAGSRQVAIGLGAAALTYGIGRLIGVNLGG